MKSRTWSRGAWPTTDRMNRKGRTDREEGGDREDWTCLRLLLQSLFKVFPHNYTSGQVSTHSHSIWAHHHCGDAASPADVERRAHSDGRPERERVSQYKLIPLSLSLSFWVSLMTQTSPPTLFPLSSPVTFLPYFSSTHTFVSILAIVFLFSHTRREHKYNHPLCFLFSLLKHSSNTFIK